MSVKIEILDYKYSETEGTQMIANSGFATSTDWYEGSGWSISGGAATNSGINGYLNNTNVNFTLGQTYRIKYKISGRTAGSLILANHLSGGANGFNQSNNGTFEYDWVQGGSNNNKLSLAGWSGFDGSIEWVVVYPISGVDWDNSIVGELDITDHSDFPLALTFQISDFKDLTSTSGDYSKTFKIPATKNNNNLLKNLYIPNISVDNKVTDKKSCRILFNNLYSLVGLIQVDGVGGYGETPSYYSCVFFGSNLSWADKIQDTYMNTISWGEEGEGLTYNKDSIVATWQDEDCNSSNSPLVYPITSYGDYNELGTARTIQLLDTASNQPITNGSTGYYGFNDDGNTYGTPDPVADWRPSVFVKTTLDKIFNAIGYQINSAFMDTDMFKKLVWLLPNFKYNDPDQRVLDYSVRTNFVNGVSMSVSVYSGGVATTVSEQGILSSDYGGYVTYNDDNTAGGVPNYTGNPTAQGSGGTKLVPLDATRLNITLNNGSYVDTVNDYVTIGEYGYYDIKLNGLQTRLANGRKGGSDVEHINTIKVCVNMDVQTVGQSSWATIDRGVDNQNPLNSNGNPDTNVNSSQFSSFQNLSSIEISGRWFNKGDKIRLTTGLKITYTSENGQNYMMTTFTRFANSSNFNIELNPLHVEYGQTYDLSEVMNTDYKQIDFIKGIAHAFNLQMTTDESTKTINIEPFDTFYQPYGDAIDWTAKVNRANEISDKWLQSDLKRNLVFKYKSDSADAKVKHRGEQFFDKIEDEYPYRETLPKTFKRGDSTFENPFFAGTYNGKDQDTISNSAYNDTAYSGILWTENFSVNDLGRPDKGYDFLPRLLYWNKYSQSPSNLNGKRAFAQTWTNSIGIISAGVTGQSGLLSETYPQATMVNRDSTTSPLLSYGNAYVRDYDDATGIYTSYQSGKGLYDTYYRNMIEGLKRSPRLRTVSVSLNITDIVNLDFTKLVYIDGVYWRINRIVDYKPNQNNSTKVELIEWFQIGVFGATAPMFGSSGGTWNPDGSSDDNSDIGL